MSGSRRHEGGETLIEVLLAVVIIAVSVSALLGALVTSITSSAEHRSLADLDTALRSSAESAKYDIELQPSGSAWFTECASVTSSAYNGHALSITAPSGYTVELTSIQYWNSSTNAFEPTSVDSAACISNASDQSGYQLLTFTATASSGVSETYHVAVRKPA